VKSCAECGPLLASVRDLVTELHGLEPVEASPRLVYSILDKTLGPRESVTGWQDFGILCGAWGRRSLRMEQRA
jgi:hypothetical protein